MKKGLIGYHSRYAGKILTLNKESHWLQVSETTLLGD